MTNQEKRIFNNAFERYCNAKLTNLNQAYARPSATKQAIYDQLYREACEQNGQDFRIISYNTSMFTCGYLFEDKETGVLMFRYMTKTYDLVGEAPWIS